ncbi:c-type cytochrome [Piscinibacter sp. XHJ-5]|uniref:c-type cytochrome n=1 Tax=Piscinibacter sp. XHJ-5 TaxID=3037797 RepID=UPI0024534370|nr:c-type cytochrome [Piscinibacter sp. XHJ-5]
MSVDGAKRAAAALLLAAAATAPAQTSPQRLAACAGCHGPRGNAAVAHWPSLAGQPRLFIENQLVLIREGLRDVPAMKAAMAGMTDAEITALAGYYAAQPVVPQSLPRDPAKYRAGEQTARKLLCGTCHRADYTGQQQVPRLAQQNEAYLLASMQQFRDSPGPGRDTLMASVLRGLSDEELGNLSHYLAQFGQ